jgi:hypothetical protein
MPKKKKKVKKTGAFGPAKRKAKASSRGKFKAGATSGRATSPDAPGR